MVNLHLYFCVFWIFLLALWEKLWLFWQKSYSLSSVCRWWHLSWYSTEQMEPHIRCIRNTNLYTGERIMFIILTELSRGSQCGRVMNDDHDGCLGNGGYGSRVGNSSRDYRVENGSRNCRVENGSHDLSRIRWQPWWSRRRWQPLSPRREWQPWKNLLDR